MSQWLICLEMAAYHVWVLLFESWLHSYFQLPDNAPLGVANESPSTWIPVTLVLALPLFVISFFCTTEFLSVHLSSPTVRENFTTVILGFSVPGLCHSLVISHLPLWKLPTNSYLALCYCLRLPVMSFAHFQSFPTPSRVGAGVKRDSENRARFLIFLRPLYNSLTIWFLLLNKIVF